MDALEWLARWEQIEAPGRHTRICAAPFAHGYKYDPHAFRAGGVSRAIPVDGTVGSSWHNSPQVRFWLEPERKTLWRRIMEWLKT